MNSVYGSLTLFTYYMPLLVKVNEIYWYLKAGGLKKKSSKPPAEIKVASESQAQHHHRKAVTSMIKTHQNQIKLPFPSLTQ
jgi:hypothetical protein